MADPGIDLVPPGAPLPPGPSESPLRQTWSWVHDPITFLERNHARFGDRFTVRFARFPPIVMLSDPSDIREVLAADPEVLRSGEANRALQATLGSKSLLVLDGEEHLRERRLLLPPFHGERMRTYRDLIVEATERSLAEWPRDTPFATAPWMRAITLEVILRAVFGVREPERRAELGRALSRLLDAVTTEPRVLALMLMKPGGPLVDLWTRYAPTVRSLDRLIAEQITRGRERLRTDGPGDDILSLLLEIRDEDGRPLGDRHLRDQLVTLTTAGHETTATALAWALERLVREPGSLERLAAGNDDADAFADSVVAEILRLRPVVPFVIRQLAADARIGDMDVPAGARLAPCAHLVQRRADLYPEPDRFRPDRFLAKPPKGPGWIPFGGGTRRCIGAAFATYEMKGVLTTIARSGRLRAPFPEGEETGRRGLTLAPADGGRVVWE